MRRDHDEYSARRAAHHQGIELCPCYGHRDCPHGELCRNGYHDFYFLKSGLSEQCAKCGARRNVPAVPRDFAREDLDAKEVELFKQQMMGDFKMDPELINELNKDITRATGIPSSIMNPKRGAVVDGVRIIDVGDD